MCGEKLLFNLNKMSQSELHRVPYAFSKSGLLPREEMLEVDSQKRRLVIGIPKEKCDDEYRIPLTPQGVELITQAGHAVFIQQGASINANYNDFDYSEAGAQIVKSIEDVYQADIILKVMAPSEEEINLFRPDQLLISQMDVHSQSKELLRKLMDKKVCAIGYEALQDGMGNFPILRVMSEIEGYVAIMVASEYLSVAHNGKGVLFGGITGISPTEIVILGAGTAGEFAARASLGLGATVKIFDNSYNNLREVERNLGQRVFTSVLHPQAVTKALKSADVVLGCLHYSPHKGKPYIITEEQISQMKRGSIVIDLSITLGGSFETSVCTSIKNPSYFAKGVLHYCVPNIASQVSRTSTIALSNIFAPMLLKLADSGGFSQLIKEDLGICQGVYLYKGILTNRRLAHRFDLPYSNIDLLMAAF